ncbi:TPM domain-containing protein [Chitinibacter sp. SCUT-21]|uniref:TPM domain-containing protein n=1 Tax=Chitinibacter sp. SCUT-21 TaxID=2970891 RepID=UPI0035A5A1BD
MDLSGTLSDSEQQALKAKLHALEQSKGGQFAVLIIPSTGIESIEQYSIRVVEQWQLGQKGLDNGVLLLIAKNDRAVRIEVGRGLEGSLPDVIASRIIREVIVPQFKNGHYYAGIDGAIDQIGQYLQAQALGSFAPEPPHFALDTPLACIGIVLIGLLLWAFFGANIAAVILLIGTYAAAVYGGAVPQRAGIAALIYGLLFGFIVLITRAVRFLNQAETTKGKPYKKSSHRKKSQGAHRSSDSDSGLLAAASVASSMFSTSSSSSSDSDSYSGDGGSFGGGGASGSW